VVVGVALGKQMVVRGTAVSIAHCLLLLFDHDHLGVDEDGVWCPVNLGLGVVKSGDLFPFSGRDSASTRWRQTVEVTHADFARTSSRQDL
jgi:hypothetical protein